jgi:hypothetical protein
MLSMLRIVRPDPRGFLSAEIGFPRWTGYSPIH